MNSKILLLSVAVIAVGLFAMPSTLSLFAGQHTFDSGSQVQCQKCHQDIYDEMGGSGIFGSSTAHSSLTDCSGCHKTGTITGTIPLGNGTLGNYSQDVMTSGAHAAVTMECAGCHTAVPTALQNASEAHGEWYTAGTTSTILKGANEACVGCHTHTNVNATWKRSTGMNLTVNEDITGAYVITIQVNNNSYTTKTSGGSVPEP